MKVEYTQKEKEIQKGQLLNAGINATTMMNNLKEEVEKSGINDPRSLKVNFNQPDM